MSEGAKISTYTDWLDLLGGNAERFMHSSLAEDEDGLIRAPLYYEAAHSTATDIFGDFDRFPFVRSRGQAKNWQIGQRIVLGSGINNSQILNDLTHGVGTFVLDMRFASDITLDRLDNLLASVDLSIVPLLLVGAAGNEALQLLSPLLTRRKVPQTFCGHFYHDPMTHAAQTETSLNLDFTQLIALAHAYPNMGLLCASDEAWHMAGADVITELGFVTANFIAYARALTAQGLDMREAFTRIPLALQLDTDFFVAIAKIRAARGLAAHIMKVAGVDDVAPEIHGFSSIRDHSLNDAFLNSVRTTISGLAGGIGGVDMLVVPPCTARATHDSDVARRLARNTQSILQEEAHITRTHDAAGGSWYLDHLTQNFIAKGWALMQTIEAQGGIDAARVNGFIAEHIETHQAPQHKLVATDCYLTDTPTANDVPLTPATPYGTGVFAPRPPRQADKTKP